MKDIKIKNEKFEQHFQSILDRWIDLINHYTENIADKDAAYWYNERATLSVLAGAAWKCDYFALEEFCHPKATCKTSWNGRVDLWLQCKEEQYVIEAKQIKVSIPPQRVTTLKRIQSALQRARRDVVCSAESEQTGLGVVFVVPKIPLSHKSQAETLVSHFVQELEQIDYDLLAYTFAPESETTFGNGLYPGVALLGRVPRRTL